MLRASRSPGMLPSALLAIAVVVLLPVFRDNIIVAGQTTPGMRPNYTATRKNWATVVSDCLAAGRREKRFFHMVIRAAFHDAMSVPSELVPCTNCGGADGSVLLNAEEGQRIENFEFAQRTAAVIRSISRRHQVSIADALAVCAMAAPGGLTSSADMFNILAPTNVRLRVGRRDSASPSRQGTLPGPINNNINLQNFLNGHGFTTEEGVALLGTHSLLKRQGCLSNNASSAGDVCNPDAEACDNTRMYQFNNHFFSDACSMRYSISDDPTVSGSHTVNVPSSDPKFQEIRREQMCRFTSATDRSRIQQAFQAANDTSTLGDILDPQFTGTFTVNISPPSLFSTWPYTILDAFMGKACQGELDADADQQVGAAMRKFAASNSEWLNVYATAYVKMMNVGASFAGSGVLITGRECARGWTTSRKSITPASTCRRTCPNPTQPCPAVCRCA